MNRISITGVLFVVVNVILLMILAFYAIWPVRELQTLYSPDRDHWARLLRVDGFDRIYFVKVDGVRVYTSPDFAPSNDVPFRETLFWDATGKVVVLEVARHRIFGYDVSRSRELTDEELLAVAAPPDPPLWEYGFEWKWPGIGRVQRGENK